MQEVKYIELCFENCEEVRIERQDIGLFWCDEITSSVARVAGNSISKHLFCKELYVEINPRADKHYDCFGAESEYTVFKRIMNWRDITHVNICYEDGTEDYVAVMWNEENECTNAYQSEAVDDFGNLHVMVSESEKIDKEKANNQSTGSDWRFLS